MTLFRNLKLARYIAWPKAEIKNANSPFRAPLIPVHARSPCVDPMRLHCFVLRQHSIQGTTVFPLGDESASQVFRFLTSLGHTNRRLPRCDVFLASACPTCSASNSTNSVRATFVDVRQAKGERPRLRDQMRSDRREPV